MAKIDSLTGIRFFAAAAIFIWHSEQFVSRAAFGPIYLAGAVPVFFVLSGFVLTVNAAKYSSWRDFFVARVARIWPGHMAALAFLLTIFLPWSAGNLIRHADQRMHLGIDVLLMQAWFPDEAVHYSYNGVAWSVSVELFFYAVFPLCLAAMSRAPTLRAALLTVAIFSVVNFVGHGIPDFEASWLSRILPPACLPFFVMGIAAARVSMGMPDSKAGFGFGTAMQCLAVVAALGANAWLSWITLPGLSLAGLQFVRFCAPAPFYALLLIALARYDGVVSRVLALRWFVYGGEISYSIYLIHQPVIRWHENHASAFASVPLWSQYLAVIVVTLATSALSYRFVEGPGRRALLALWRSLRRDQGNGGVAAAVGS